MCTDGQYISNKICVDCPGHCKDEAPCNKLTGMCDNGCANQWTGTFCNCMLLGGMPVTTKFYLINRKGFISETRFCCSKKDACSQLFCTKLFFGIFFNDVW